MGVCREGLRVSNHTLNWLVRSTCGCMVHIHALKLNVEGTDIFGIEAYDIFPNNFNFGFLALFIFSLQGSGFYAWRDQGLQG